jgi:DNA repair protein RadC
MTAIRTLPASVSPLGRRYLAREAVALYSSPIARCPLDPAAMTREDRLIARAKKALARRLAVPGAVIDSPAVVRNFLMFELGEEAREVFCALFLDAQNRVISFETLSVGTTNQTSVHPREVVRRCLELNSSVMIFAHNHPSGVTEPSEADKALTNALKRALGVFDVRVLDHFIVGGVTRPLSFAERGLL